MHDLILNSISRGIFRNIHRGGTRHRYNWCAAAGQTGGRLNRFNIVKQGKDYGTLCPLTIGEMFGLVWRNLTPLPSCKYPSINLNAVTDQHGDYVRLWCPELKDVPNEFVHSPWKMSYFHQQQCHCHLGVDYPNPIVPPSTVSVVNTNAHNPGGGRGGGGEKQRWQPSGKNKHQAHEMKSVKTGTFRLDGS